MFLLLRTCLQQNMPTVFDAMMGLVKMGHLGKGLLLHQNLGMGVFTRLVSTYVNSHRPGYVDK